MIPTQRAMRRLTRRLLLTTLLLVPLAACDDGTSPDGADVTVMSRNVYLGANIFQLSQAENQQELVVVAGQLYGDVVATDFPTRVEGLAAEIEAHDPALVGLQEVSLYRVQAESDFQDFPLPNAETVTFDFLQLLLDALEERGLDYYVAASIKNADSELPAVLDPENPEQLSDVRLTDRDVILARGDVSTSNADWSNYEEFARLGAGGFQVPFPRGWVAVDARVDGVELRFVNSHVEGIMPAHEAQILELVEVTNTMETPLILVGDLNTQPDMAETPGYGHIVLNGPFTDVWTEVGEGDGFTCCVGADLLSETPTFDERIDYVLYRGDDIEPISAEVVGDELADRTSGLWPSDHAGVVATFRID